MHEREVSGMEKDRLVRLARAGDRDALGLLCEHFYPLLHRFFRRMGASDADADDFSQDTLLKMMEKLHTFQFFPGRSFSAWLFRIAYNRFIDHARRKKALPLTDDFPAVDPAPTPEQSALKNESISEVRRAVAALDSELQALIALRYELDMSYREIAQAMDITPTRVKWRLNEALKKLRAAMREENPTSEGGMQT